ncbi:hypothetical protein MYX07_02800 [Patescibacteria group bacterium AH-259-L07]|nr:hypothetical protein [Patescibacteria group bacterium AH-259-L07]
MKQKTELKNKAIELRKQGLSYNEILEQVPVAKSSISLWCRNIPLTARQQKRLFNKQLAGQRKGYKKISLLRQQEIQKIRQTAGKEIYKLTSHELKIVGTMLYWGEGGKTRGMGVDISNSDPKLIKFMVYWLKNVCKVSPEKIKARLNIHADQNDNRIKRYWSKITGIPLTSFGKSYIKPEGTGHRKNILHNGVIKIRVGDENLRHRIMTWIKMLQQYQL